MERKNLYIDFDGVILDTITQSYADIKRDLLNPTEEETCAYYATYPWETIIKDENIINDSIECIKKIINSNKFNLAILTHVNSLNEAIIKINYLRKYFKDITIIPCPKAISKTKMIHTAASILIDDYAGNLREWVKEGGIPITFSLTNEDKGYPTISKLDQIIDLF